jgi:hypothetical protein
MPADRASAGRPILFPDYLAVIKDDKPLSELELLIVGCPCDAIVERGAVPTRVRPRLSAL